MTLRQIVADTLAVAVYPSLDHEASARGVALLALEAIGLLPDVAQVPAHLKPPVQPDAGKHAVYRKGAERQQKLYQTLLEGKYRSIAVRDPPSNGIWLFTHAVLPLTLSCSSSRQL